LLVGAVTVGLASCHKTDPDVTKILGAARSGDLQAIRLLLNQNPNLVFSKGSEGSTALHYAATYGYMEIADLLLSKSADVNAKTKKGETPLHYAASGGYRDVVELLLSNKANVDARDGIGCTPLYYAATNGRIEEVKMLLAAKADVNARTVRGYSVPSGAASYGREDIVRLLIDSGANVNSADFDGGTPVHWARKMGYKRIEDFLRQHGGVEIPPAQREWPYP
jgi:serine/threonine-protein phosphatase 6 regulatory ankyrin repeat subunit B